MRIVAAVACCCVACPGACATGQVPAQDFVARPIPAVRAAEAPVIDGDPGDAAWAHAPVAATFIDPYTGKPAAEQTEARILYDERAVYVAFRCHDSQPDAIVAREIRHGAAGAGEDSVSFEIDPFYTRSAGTSRFTVNPLGTRSESIAGGRAAKQEWTGEWQAAARRTPDGWTAEMRIPWAVLSYPGGSNLNMGVNFLRSHLRTHVDSWWSNYTSKYHPENIGVWQGVTPPAAAGRRALRTMVYASPTWANGLDRSSARSGFDLRYTPNPRMTGVLSVAPDFQNVEQQVETIAFSRSEIYLGDSRPFFAEGSDHFGSSLFYSRRIGDFDVGGKAFGNATDRLAFGVLSALKGARDSASVAGLSYSLPGGSSVSLAATLRSGWDLAPHNGIGTNAYIRTGTWRLLADLVHASEGASAGTYGRAALAYTAPHWWVDAHWEQVDRGFRPALGYIDFVDRRGPLLSASYDSEYRHGPLRRVLLNTTLYRFRHYDGTDFQDHRAVALQAETRSDHYVQITGEDSRFEGTRDRYVSLLLAGSVSDRWRQWAVSYDTGTRASRAYGYLSCGLTRRLFGGLDVSLSASVLRHIENRELYVLTLGREFDARRALNARLVEQDGSLNWYVAYRNAGGLGQDVYLIVGDPNARTFTPRLALKWVRAL